MFRTTTLAIVAVLALQPNDSLANHISEAQAIAAFQALQAQVEALEAENAAQQAQIDELLAPAGMKTVFVTSLTYNGDLATAGGGVNGLQGADNICNAHALDGIVPPGHYIAWLSTSLKDAKDRLPANDQGYVLPDGTTEIATSKADLLDGDLLRPINQDEHGVDYIAGGGWTGTTAAGEVIDPTKVCDDWTTDEVTAHSHTGIIVSSDVRWTEPAPGTVTACSSTWRLYCFER